MTRASGSLFHTYFAVFSQVLFLSVARVPSSSTVWETSFQFAQGAGCCFVCHPLDDQLEFFFVMAFFITAKFFFTLDGVKEKVKKKWTLS